MWDDGRVGEEGASVSRWPDSIQLRVRLGSLVQELRLLGESDRWLVRAESPVDVYMWNHSIDVFAMERTTRKCPITHWANCPTAIAPLLPATAAEFRYLRGTGTVPEALLPYRYKYLKNVCTCLQSAQKAGVFIFTGAG